MTVKRITILLAALLVLPGCGMIAHEFDEGVTHPVYSPWAAEQTATLSAQWGTAPDLETRFLDIGPQGDRFGWYGPSGITVVLRDRDGSARHACNVRNVWRHEWLHHLEGTIRLDDHETEYRGKLIAMGLWESCP